MDISSLGNFTAASRFAADGAVDETLKNEISKRRPHNSQIPGVTVIINSLLMPPMPSDKVEQEDNQARQFAQGMGSRVNLRV